MMRACLCVRTRVHTHLTHAAWQVNLKRLAYFIGGYLADTNRQGLHVPRQRKGEATYSDSAHVSDVRLHDPAEVLLDAARDVFVCVFVGM